MSRWLSTPFAFGAASDHPSGSVELFPCEAEAMRPPPDLTVAEWADARRILQPGTSRKPGPWRTETAPYSREVMNAYNDPGIRQIRVCWGTQLGKTEILFNLFGFVVDLEPYSTLLVYPREEDAKTVSRGRLQPMLEACPTIREKIPRDRELFQTLEMHFPGMVAYLVGANSPAALAMKPCRNILRDEIDKYPDRVGDDADPLSLSEERAKTFWDIRKVVDVSSPTLEARGIWKLLQTCDEIRYFMVPCPHCSTRIRLLFPMVEWDHPPDGAGAGWKEKIQLARTTARVICPKCRGMIRDDHKAEMLAEGRWEPEAPCPFPVQSVGYQLSSLYSPFLTFGDVAAQFLEAKRKLDEEGTRSGLQNFFNGWMAEPWSEVIETAKESQLRERIGDLPPLTAPVATVGITCGIDMQKTGFYFTVWAFGPKLESWLISYGFLPSWADLSSLVFETTFPQEKTGRNLRIWRAGLDTGGTGEEDGEMSRTAEAYQFLRLNGRNVLFGTKGLSKNARGPTMIRHTVLDRLPNGKKLPGGLVLFLLDTAKLKDVFAYRLSSGPTDPQPVLFHAETGDEFFRHLLAEKKIRNRQNIEEWVRVHKANHYLDASIIAHACADAEWGGGIPLLARKIAERAKNPKTVPAETEGGPPKPRKRQLSPDEGENPYLSGISTGDNPYLRR